MIPATLLAGLGQTLLQMTPAFTGLVLLRNSNQVINTNRSLEEKRQQVQLELQRLNQQNAAQLQAERITHEQSLASLNRETQLQIALAQREVSLQLPEIHRILDNWPLRLLPSQILNSHEGSDRIPLRIFISPPEIDFERFSNPSRIPPPQIEKPLTQGLRDFLARSYPLNSQTRPTEFLGGAWESKRFYGESSIKALFQALKSEPTLILESEVYADKLNFRIAYWGLGQRNYHYRTIASGFSHREIIAEIAKARGNNEPSNEDIEEFYQFLITWHCLIAGWIIDAHHLIHYDVAPLLPKQLPELLEKVSDPVREALNSQIVATIIPGYQELYRSLKDERPSWSFKFDLQLAQSLSSLSDKSLAKENLASSIESWLRLRQVNSERAYSLQDIHSVVTVEDRSYLEEIQQLFYVLGDSESSAQVQELLIQIDAMTSILDSQEGGEPDLSHQTVSTLPTNLLTQGRRVMENLPNEIQAQIEEFKTTLLTIKEHLREEEEEEIKKSIARLENLEVSIAAFGEVNAGKSSLLNSMLGISNQDPNRPFSSDENINIWSDEIANNNGVTWQSTEDLNLVIYDTPGIAGDVNDHLDIAKQIARKSDIILYVLAEPVKGDLQTSTIRELVALGRPLIAVINKIDTRTEKEILSIKNDLIKKTNLPEDMIALTAAEPLRVISDSPIVDDLIDKILSIVQAEKFDLIVRTVQAKVEEGVINANEVLQGALRNVSLKLIKEDKKRGVEETVSAFANTAALIAAPVPLKIDIITSALVTGGMLNAVANKYGQKIDFETGLRVAGELTNAFIRILLPKGVAWVAITAISAGAKTNPFTYLAGAALDYALTYFIVSAVGNSFSEYCANEGIWVRSPDEVVREYMKKNIGDFLNKLPKRFRGAVEQRLNPELLQEG